MSDFNPEVDDLPQVSFGIGLGNHIDNIDFDYDAYRRLIFEMGGSSDDYINAKIHIDTYVRARRDVGGGYSYGKISASILADTVSSPNERIIHETSHYFDDMQGIRDGRIYTVFGNICYFGGRIALMPALGVGGGALLTGHERLAAVVAGTEAGLFITGKLAYYLMYMTNPAEKRAFGRQKEFSNIQILKTDAVI